MRGGKLPGWYGFNYVSMCLIKTRWYRRYGEEPQGQVGRGEWYSVVDANLCSDIAPVLALPD